jgi:hypothetical protein
MESLDLRAASRAAAALLQAEVQRMRERGIPVGEDDLRGLYVSEDEANRIIASAGESTGSPADARELVAACGPRLARAVELFRLGSEEAGAIALCFVG